MPVLAAFAFANLKHDAAALWTWLCHRSFWQLVSLALAIFALIQHFEIIAARHDAAKWQKQYTSVKKQLDQISSRKNDQKAVTKDNVVTVTKVIHDADGVAKKIEQAPPTKDCKTPPVIMGADL